MLQEFQAGHDIELTAMPECIIFRTDLFVVDTQSAFPEMQAGNSERFITQVYARNIGAIRRQPFRQQAAAATDIQDLLSGDLHPLLDVVGAQGVDVMERLELAFGIPPSRCEVAEPGQFFRINVVLWFFGCHVRFAARW